MLKVFADAGLQARRKLVGRRRRTGLRPARRRRRSRLGTLPGRGGQPGGPRRRGEPAAPVRSQIGGRGRGQPQARRRSAGPSCTTSSPAATPDACTRSTRMAQELEGVPCLPSAAALPDRWISPWWPCPRRGGPGGRRGMRPAGRLVALVVITADLDAAAKAALLACCRRHGMRLIGPNCFGIAVPGHRPGRDVRRQPPEPRATAGLAVQSGGLGIALGEQLSRLGIGISSFASLGDKCDVSGNDLLMWWEQDLATTHGGAVPRVVRQPAQVRPDRPPCRVGPCRCSPCTPAAPRPGSAPPPRTPRRPPPRWSPGRRCSSRRASSPPRTSVSCWKRLLCWPASRCPVAAEWRSYPTPAAPGCSRPTPAPTRACTSPSSAPRYSRRFAAGCHPAPKSPARSTPPRRLLQRTSAAAWN